MLSDKQKALDELDIPEDIYDSLLNMFVDQTEPQIIDLTDAVQSRNFEKAAEIAHSIKGSAMNLRMENIHIIAKDIEGNVKGNIDIKTITEQIMKLKAMIEDMKNIEM